MNADLLAQLWIEVSREITTAGCCLSICYCRSNPESFNIFFQVSWENKLLYIYVFPAIIEWDYTHPSRLSGGGAKREGLELDNPEDAPDIVRTVILSWIEGRTHGLDSYSG